MSVRFSADTLHISRLEAPKLVEADYDIILAERLAELAERLGAHGIPYDTGNLKSEPAGIVEQHDGDREHRARQSINDALKAASLPFSWGKYLDVAAAALLTRRRQIGTDGNGDPVYEKDPEFLERTLLAPEAFSVCSAGGYAYTAWGAHPDIKHVACHHIGGNQMKLTLLSRQGDGTPSAEALAAADAAIHDAKRKNKGGTDVIRIMLPDIPHYAINVRAIARSGFDKDDVKVAMEKSLADFGAVMHKHGERVDFEGIGGAGKVPGVFRLYIDLPTAEIDEAPFTAPYCEAISVEVL